MEATHTHNTHARTHARTHTHKHTHTHRIMEDHNSSQQAPVCKCLGSLGRERVAIARCGGSDPPEGVHHTSRCEGGGGNRTWPTALTESAIAKWNHICMETGAPGCSPHKLWKRLQQTHSVDQPASGRLLTGRFLINTGTCSVQFILNFNPKWSSHLIFVLKYWTFWNLRHLFKLLYTSLGHPTHASSPTSWVLVSSTCLQFI